MHSTVRQAEVVEIAIGEAPGDPWAGLDVEIVRPDGSTVRVPAFASRGVWRLRYSSEDLGVHHYRAGDERGEIVVEPREPGAIGSAAGGIRVAADRRHFERVDGSPFLWTGDTWWHGFVTEKIADDEFETLARERAEAGFSVIQIVVVPPEADAFEESVRCRTGWAWEPGFTALNLAWFDDADVRIRALVENGLVPCIVGSWGYHLGQMDDRAAVRQWREMLARWAAYPVVWCISGEVRTTWSRPEDPPVPEIEVAPGEAFTLRELTDLAKPRLAPQLARINLLARHLRDADPFDRPVTIHVYPGEFPWEFVEDESTLDFWMLQTGHGGYADVSSALDQVDEAIRHEPVKPVVNGEASYEGIGGGSWEDVQRLLFWSHILSGVAGFTYGAHGLWAMNTERFPGQYSGLAYPWREASRFRGGQHIAAGSRWLRGLPWQTLRPRGDLVTPSQEPGHRVRPYAAELDDGTRLIYLPATNGEGNQLIRPIRLERLGGRTWSGRAVDLRTGEEYPEFRLEPGEDDACPVPPGEVRSWADWVLVLRPA